jgi:rSAM/selenodomain-associated transferase 1
MAVFIDSSNKHYAFPQYRLLVFTKSPILGLAKTRMQPLLPKEFSLALHCQLLKTVLTQWTESPICPIDCWIAGDKSPFIEKIINVDMPNMKMLPLYQQRGRDLGERLSWAIATTFADNNHNNTTVNKAVQAHKNIEGVFVVGTDCPSLSAEYLKTACSMLAHYDAVIGPAEDGGYVLLGLKAPNAELFKGVEWGGSAVLEQTLSKLRKFNLSYFELPILADIDHPEDLIKLQKHDAFSSLLDQAYELIGHQR